MHLSSTRLDAIPNRNNVDSFTICHATCKDFDVSFLYESSDHFSSQVVAHVPELLNLSACHPAFTDWSYFF